MGVGLALGLLVADFVKRLLGGLLMRVHPLDPVTYGGIVTVLVVVGALASYLPARRATRTNPVEALRSE